MLAERKGVRYTPLSFLLAQPFLDPKEEEKGNKRGVTRLEVTYMGKKVVLVGKMMKVLRHQKRKILCPIQVSSF